MSKIQYEWPKDELILKQTADSKTNSLVHSAPPSSTISMVSPHLFLDINSAHQRVAISLHIFITTVFFFFLNMSKLEATRHQAYEIFFPVSWKPFCVPFCLSSKWGLYVFVNKGWSKHLLHIPLPLILLCMLGYEPGSGSQRLGAPAIRKSSRDGGDLSPREGMEAVHNSNGLAVMISVHACVSVFPWITNAARQKHLFPLWPTWLPNLQLSCDWKLAQRAKAQPLLLFNIATLRLDEGYVHHLAFSLF